jgi:hypothetical protein
MTKQRIYDDATVTVYTNETHPASTKYETKHPAHYNNGIECWDYIASHNMGFLEGNIIKYVTRYKHKNGKEDLLKAREYLNKLILQYEKDELGK